MGMGVVSISLLLAVWARMIIRSDCTSPLYSFMLGIGAGADEG